MRVNHQRYILYNDFTTWLSSCMILKEVISNNKTTISKNGKRSFSWRLQHVLFMMHCLQFIRTHFENHIRVCNWYIIHFPSQTRLNLCYKINNFIIHQKINLNLMNKSWISQICSYICFRLLALIFFEIETVTDRPP